MVEAGVVMALVGATLLVVEAHVPAGVVGLVVAALLAAGAVAGVWLMVVTRKALGTRRLRAASGREALSGRVGVVRNWYGVGGQVFVDGALWRARRSWADEEGDLRNGDPVVVERVNGLTLAVRKAEEWEEQW